MVQKDKSLWFFVSVFLFNTVFKVHRYLGLSPEMTLYYQLVSFVLLFLLAIWCFRDVFRNDFSVFLKWKVFYLVPLFYFVDSLIGYLTSFLQVFLMEIFQLSEGVNNTHALSRITDLLPLPLFLFVIGIAGPVVEEAFYRKWLLDKCKHHFPNWLAILLQGFLFGLVHGRSLAPAEIISTLPQIASGIYAGYLYHRTDNLYYPIILHCLNNLLVGY